MVDTPNPAIPLEVDKKAEFGHFIELVENGVWKNNSFLADLCEVDRETIARWKTYPIAKQALRKAASRKLKSWSARGDIDKQLKELGMDVEADKLDTTLTVKIEDYTE